MKRLVVAVALASSCCGLPPASPLGPQAGGLVWQIDGEATLASGTPVAVIDRELWLLTAAHVTITQPVPGWKAVSRAGDILVGGRTGPTHPALDAAFVIFPLPPDYPAPKTLPIDGARLELGDTVWTAGWGGSKALWVTEALAQSDRRLTGGAYFGDSGGAIIDEDGELRGLLIGIGGANRTHQVFFIAVADLLPWLASLGITA